MAAIDLTSSLPTDSVLLKVGFPETGITKTVRCSPSMNVGEIKQGFHNSCQFEDELYSFFVPGLTTSSKGSNSLTEGRWLDETLTVSENNLTMNQKVLLLKRPPPTQSNTFPLNNSQNAKPKSKTRHAHTLSRFFGLGSNENSSSSTTAKSNSFSLSFSANKPSKQKPEPPPPQPQTASSSNTLTRTRKMSFDTSNQQIIAKIDTEKSPQQRKEVLTSFLSNFLDARLSLNDLVARHVIFEKPITEVPLDMSVIEKCCNWINEYGTTTEGIFRISGPTQEVSGLVDQFITGNFELDKRQSPHTIASSLKQYLRERVFPIIPYRCFRVTLKKHSITKLRAYNESEIQEFFSHLPPDKIPPLFYLLGFLKGLLKFEKITKMGLANLVIVFSPVLMKTRAEGMASLSENEAQCELLLGLLNHFVCFCLYFIY